MEVEFGAAGVDHDLARVVVEKERDVGALGGHLDPCVASAPAFPFPDHGAKVVASAPGDGRDHGVGADGLAVEFDHPHGGAANLGNRSVEDEVFPAQQAETVEEEIDAGAESDDAPGDQPDGIVGRKQDSSESQLRENQEFDPLGWNFLGHTPFIEASGAGAGGQQKRAEPAYVGNGSGQSRVGMATPCRLGATLDECPSIA